MVAVLLFPSLAEIQIRSGRLHFLINPSITLLTGASVSLLLAC